MKFVPKQLYMNLVNVILLPLLRLSSASSIDLYLLFHKHNYYKNNNESHNSQYISILFSNNL